MKIGIVTNNEYNSYASKLLSKLRFELKPECIILTRKPKKFSDQIKNTPLAKILKSFIKDGKLTDKEKESFKKISLIEICKKDGIEIIEVTSINSSEVVNAIRQKELDLLLYAGGGILKKDLINSPKIGVLNAHMGFLPAFRGMNVLEWSLLCNHKIGVTLHFIDTSIDRGDILLFEEIPIEKGDTITSLREKSVDINVKLMIDVIKLLLQQKINRAKQKPEDGKQYFVMHSRLKSIAEKKLTQLASKTPTLNM